MVLRSWLHLAIHNEYRPAYDRLEAFLKGTGRNHLIGILYTALMDTGQQDFAQSVYEAARPGYHPITVAANEPVVYPQNAE